MPEASTKLKVTFETKTKKQSSLLVEADCAEVLYDDNDNEVDSEFSELTQHFEEGVRRRLINAFGSKGYRVIKIEKVDT
jgi:hypothetical protein